MANEMPSERRTEGSPDVSDEMSESTANIQAHLHDITDELLHGANSHEDPNLPENWERLERGGNTPELDSEVDRQATTRDDLAPQNMKIRSAEAVGGQAPL